MSPRYFHGGFGGLSVGQHVLPPNVTKAPSTASYGAGGVCSRDRVYITTEFDAALVFACAHPSGRGKVYEVEPTGQVTDDPDARAMGYSYECEKARVVKVFKIRGKTIRNMQRALLTGERP